MAVMGGWKIFARNGGQGRNRRGGGKGGMGGGGGGGVGFITRE